MSNKQSEKKDPNNQSNQSTPSTPQTVKMREDTIPVIVVNGVYYPS